MFYFSSLGLFRDFSCMQYYFRKHAVGRVGSPSPATPSGDPVGVAGTAGPELSLSSSSTGSCAGDGGGGGDSSGGGGGGDDGDVGGGGGGGGGDGGAQVAARGQPRIGDRDEASAVAEAIRLSMADAGGRGAYQ